MCQCIYMLILVRWDEKSEMMVKLMGVFFVDLYWEVDILQLCFLVNCFLLFSLINFKDDIRLVALDFDEFISMWIRQRQKMMRRARTKKEIERCFEATNVFNGCLFHDNQFVSIVKPVTMNWWWKQASF